MLTSNAAPMLGTLTPDRWGKSLRRYDRPCSAVGRRQIRAARLFERQMVDLDLASVGETVAEWDLSDVGRPIVAQSIAEWEDERFEQDLDDLYLAERMEDLDEAGWYDRYWDDLVYRRRLGIFD